MGTASSPGKGGKRVDGGFCICEAEGRPAQRIVHQEARQHQENQDSRMGFGKMPPGLLQSLNGDDQKHGSPERKDFHLCFGKKKHEMGSGLAKYEST